MRYLKTYESYWTEQEYIGDVQSGLTKYNIRPVELNKIVGEYEDEILDYRNSGKHPSLFVDKIVKELDLDKGGFISQKTTPKGPWDQSYL